MHGPLCAQKHTRGMGALFSIFTLPLLFLFLLHGTLTPNPLPKKYTTGTSRPHCQSFFRLAILNSPRNGGLLLPLLKAFKRLL